MYVNNFYYETMINSINICIYLVLQLISGIRTVSLVFIFAARLRKTILDGFRVFLCSTKCTQSFCSFFFVIPQLRYLKNSQILYGFCIYNNKLKGFGRIWLYVWRTHMYVVVFVLLLFFCSVTFVQYFSLSYV